VLWGVIMATIKEIAVKTGFSLSTVSIVLSGNAEKRKISDSTKNLIMDTARALGYKPNISARRLRNNEAARTLIALFLADDFRISSMLRFLNGLRREIVDRQDFEIVIQLYRPGALKRTLTSEMLSMFNAAIICNSTEEDINYLELQDFAIPIVLYNRRSKKYCSVSVNNAKIGEMSAEVLASRGHSACAVLTSEPLFLGNSEREDSFIAKAKELGMDVVKTIACSNSMEGGYAGGLEFAELPGCPSGLFCSSDRLALGALRAFSKRGIKVPEDVEIISVGNGDPEAAEFAPVSLSIMKLPLEEMARLCYRQVADLMDGRRNVLYAIDLPVTYEARESCGPEMK